MFVADKWRVAYASVVAYIVAAQKALAERGRNYKEEPKRHKHKALAKCL